MTKIDIISGFLGAGKTTLIKKLLSEGFKGEQVVLIENEFGEIGIDGGFLKEAGIEIREMNSGCICCSLVGDFGKSLHEVVDTYHPDRILIEPSGVGKLSDVIKAVQDVQDEIDAELNSFTTVADANKCKMYMINFSEFYNEQIEHANSIILSRTRNMAQDKLDSCVALLRERNSAATIMTTPWEELSGVQILEAMEHRNTLEEELKELAEETHHHHEDGECCCHHDHDHHHEHEHDHDHDHHHHHHEHDHDHHHADEIFTSWGMETAHKFTAEEIEQALTALADSETYGVILRAKGIVAGADGRWIHFDYVPEEHNVRIGPAIVTGRLCVIGSHIKEDALKKLFVYDSQNV